MHTHIAIPVSKDGTQSKLYIVTAIINPCRYSSRYKLYQNFKKMVENSGAILYTIEVAFRNRPFVVTTADNPHNIQLRTDCEIWHKENMLNIAISKLPSSWEYVAWIDADVFFARPDWVHETINQLQHYDFVQMFSQAIDLGPNYEPIHKHNGFIYSYINSLHFNKDYSNWHPGFAWAARKKALNHVGKLIDFAVLGSADRHMAAGLVGMAALTVNKDLTKNYKDGILRWQARAEKHIKRNVGVVEGLLLHYWHGQKRNRKYAERWQILVRNKYDPFLDLKIDWQGLWQLTDRNIKLRDDLRQYFRERNEDDITILSEDIHI